MKKWMTLIFASMFAFALSMPAWSQSAGATKQTQADKKAKKEEERKQKEAKKAAAKKAKEEKKQKSASKNK